MAKFPLGRRLRLVHRVPHERVCERHWLLVPDDLGTRQCGQRFRGTGLRDAGQCRDRRQGRTVAEDGGRPRDDHDVGWQPAQLQQYPARHRPRPDRYDPVGVGGIRPDAVSRKSLEQLTQQERVPRGRPLAGGDEQGCGSYAEPSLHQFRRRLRGQRRRPYDERLGFERQLCDEVLVVVLLAGAQGRQDQYGYRGEPSYQICQEAERGAVTPLRIVDREYQWSLGREVDRRPVQAVQHGEAFGPAAVGDVEHGPGSRCGPTQQLAATHGVADFCLEQLAYDAERERTLQRAPAGRQHPHGPLGREPARLGQQPRLSDPGRTLEQQQAGLPASEVVQRRPECGELAVPVDETVAVRGRCLHRLLPRLLGRNQFGRLREYLRLQFAESRTGVDAELVGQGLAGTPQRGQCVGLPMGAVQPERQQPPPLLPQRLLGDHPLQLGSDKGRLPEIETSGEQPLPADRSQLGQAGDLGSGPRLVGVLGQRRTAPQRERLVQRGRRLRRGRRGRLQQGLEPPGVDRVGGESYGVPGTLADDDRGPGASR